MAKTVNKHWALIESVGYTIQRGNDDNYPAQRFEVVPLRESVALQIDRAIDDVVALFYRNDTSTPGADLRRQALPPILRAKALGEGKLDGARWRALKHCSICADCHSFLCIMCATAIITPELVQECNGEAAWAAARKGGALDRAMAEMIATTPALQAERDRRALAALTPATPTATRRQSGRL